MSKTPFNVAVEDEEIHDYNVRRMPPVSPMSMSTAEDQKAMRRMGKVQVFNRNFRLITTICFTSCVMSTWELLLAASGPTLKNGGLPALFWSTCWCYVGQGFVILSLAEMSSMAPTAAGQYHWVSEFAPPGWQKGLSYICGWLSTICWQSFVTANSFTVGLILQGIIIINTTYEPQRWHGTLFVCAVAVISALANIWGAKYLPKMEAIFVTFHVILFFPVIITLLYRTPEKQSASAVFWEFTDQGGNWPNMGVSVLIGQVAVAFILLGSDAPAHLSEETLDANIVTPKSMVWSFILNMPPTFAILLTYLFCIGDVEKAFVSPTGFPFIYVFQNATSSELSASLLVATVILLLIFVSISTMTSTSRQTFAFARDNGLPFSSWLQQIDPRFETPTNVIFATVLYTCVLSLLNIGSTVAFNAILSLSTSALMATYAMAIFCVVYRKLNPQLYDTPLPPARWSLGKYGLPVNVCGIIYSVWSFFWSFWPTVYKPSAEEFNWASVALAGLMAIAGLLYAFDKRKAYHGPVTLIQRSRC